MPISENIRNPTAYPSPAPCSRHKVRSGGMIIADDVLWDGKVADPQVKLDAQTKGILNFNEMVQADSRVENILLPVRHGLMIVRKV